MAININVTRASNSEYDAQLLLGVKGDTGKSAYQYAVDGGYEGSETAFLNEMARLTTSADEAAASAEAAEAALEEFTEVTATAETLPAGSDATATYTGGTLTFGIPKGDKGDKGDSYDDSVIVAIVARMDSFTNLAEGSTTGDAELIDGRIGADGVTYTNIGGAIRGQVTDVKSDINNLGFEKIITSDNLLDPDAVMMETYINDQGVPTYSQHYVTTGLMPVSPNTKYSMFCIFQNIVISNPTAKVCAYGSDGGYLGDLGQIAYSSSTPSYVTTPNDCAFVRAQLSTGNYTSYPIVMFAETNGTSMPSSVVPYSSKYVIAIDNLKWKNKSWVAFGDSLTEQNAMTTKHYYDYVRDETGINITVMGVGGSGYAKGGTNAFYNRISNVPITADVITIFGSFNDLSSGLSLGNEDDSGTDTIAGCMNTTLDNLFTAYPLAVVGVVAPTPWQSATPLSATSSASQYCALLKRICERRSIPYLDLFHQSLLRPWDASFKSLAYTKDGGGGTHPDETGHKLIAPRFKGFLDTLLI